MSEIEYFKPVITVEEASEILKELYGIVDSKLNSVSSYDDCNFRVSDGKITKESGITCFNKDGYVLKIMNTMNSKNFDHIDGEHAMMNELLKNGINVPEPVAQKTGVYYSSKKIKGRFHAIYLLKYIVGNLMENSAYTEKLAYNCGVFMSNLHLSLANLRHKGMENSDSVWLFSNISYWSSYLDCVDDLEEKNILQSVLDMFYENVLSIKDQLPHGMIHGDFNDHNVLCENDEIVGIIDFGDSTESALVFDLAICIFYLMVDCKREDIGDWLKIGKSVIDGYQSKRRLEEIEKKALIYCVLARFLQSFASYWGLLKRNALDPYTLTMTKRQSLPKLKEIFEMGIQSIQKFWF